MERFTGATMSEVPLHLRIIGNAAMAEDIRSDVFSSVWQNAASFRSDSQVSTWLLAIARNRSYCAMRRRSEEQLEDDEAEETEDLADTPEMALRSCRGSPPISDK